MNSPSKSEEERCREYLARRYGQDDLSIIDKRLGFGNDGIVWATKRKSAVKAAHRQGAYERERDVYLRLADCGIAKIEGFAVPRMIGYEDDLWTIEMDIVQPPCVLDFAKAHLDRAPDYPPDVLADWEAEKSELFGDRWSKVVSIIGSLRMCGIFYFDATPGNIMFE